jgi:hypothetical protein
MTNFTSEYLNFRKVRKLEKNPDLQLSTEIVYADGGTIFCFDRFADGYYRIREPVVAD